MVGGSVVSVPSGVLAGAVVVLSKAVVAFVGMAVGMSVDVTVGVVWLVTSGLPFEVWAGSESGRTK